MLHKVSIPLEGSSNFFTVFYGVMGFVGIYMKLRGSVICTGQDFGLPDVSSIVLRGELRNDVN